MNLDLAPEDREFQQEVRDFFANSIPEDWKKTVRAGLRLSPDNLVAYQRRLAKRGWGAPTWPKEYGGTGWTPQQLHIFWSEASAADAPAQFHQGLELIGPIIFTYGSQAQKDFYLPRIISGEDWWCQGYSEPGAGSDLAALRTRADRDGDDYIVNGHKMWTSYAHVADRMFILARTSNEGRRQQGISLMLVDMDTPGIRISPIHTLAGDHELNQVFFDDVRVPQANRLGEENDGWSVAKHLLAFERGGVYAPALVARLREVERACPDDPVLRQKIARQAVSLEALQAIELKALRKEGPTAMYPSILKVLGTEASQAIDVLACDILGTPGWRARADDLPDDIAVTVPRYLNNRAASIYAGSNEIQRDIIAKMMLG